MQGKEKISTKLLTVHHEIETIFWLLSEEKSQKIVQSIQSKVK